MKLQREISRKYKNKEYYRYRINLPKTAIEKAKLKDGDNLKVIVWKGRLVLRKKPVRRKKKV